MAGIASSLSLLGSQTCFYEVCDQSHPFFCRMETVEKQTFLLSDGVGGQVYQICLRIVSDCISYGIRQIRLAPSVDIFLLKGLVPPL